MKSLTIGTKFRAGFLSLFAATLILGVSSIVAIRAINDSFDTAVNKTARKLQLFGDINTLKSDLYLAERGLVLGSFSKDRDGVLAKRREFEATEAKLKAKFSEVAPLVSVPEGKRLMPVLQADIDKFATVFQEVDRLSESGNPSRAVQYGWENNPAILNEMGVTADRLVAIYQEVLASDSNAASAVYWRSLWIAVGLLILSAVVGAVILLVTRQVNVDLRQVVGELTSGSDQVAAASGQIAAGSQTLSQGASEQASSVEEISASMEEMSAMTRTTGSNSSEAMAMMNETAAQVERSNAALSEMVASMSSIKSSSERVAKINKTIDEIAFQTNILALNAAVEAARAGEAGKGFAVVADEVRNLAQRAAAAAKDTAALIEESIGNSNQGAQKLELVSEAIRGITEGAQKVKQLVSEVHEAGKEQMQGIQQVSTAIQQVSTVTQSNASSAEESAAAAEELSAQSMTVRELVDKLHRMVDGDGKEAARPAAGFRNSGRLTGGRASSRPTAPPPARKAADAAEESFPMESVETGSFRNF